MVDENESSQGVEEKVEKGPKTDKGEKSKVEPDLENAVEMFFKLLEKLFSSKDDDKEKKKDPLQTVTKMAVEQVAKVKTTKPDAKFEVDAPEPDAKATEPRVKAKSEAPKPQPQSKGKDPKPAKPEAKKSSGKDFDGQLKEGMKQAAKGLDEVGKQNPKYAVPCKIASTLLKNPIVQKIACSFAKDAMKKFGMDPNKMGSAGPGGAKSTKHQMQPASAIKSSEITVRLQQAQKDVGVGQEQIQQLTGQKSGNIAKAAMDAGRPKNKIAEVSGTTQAFAKQAASEPTMKAEIESKKPKQEGENHQKAQTSRRMGRP